MARWHQGTVPADSEHIELYHGDGEDNLVPAARVRPGEPGTFVVEFAPDLDPSVLLDAVRGELDFYLVEKSEENPWVYAIYQCSTASNLYGDVHWGYFPEGKPAE